MKDNKNFGFTVPELLIAMTITSVLSILLFSISFEYMRLGQRQQNDLTAFTERLNAADFLRDRISSSSGLINQNSIPDLYAHAPDPNTSDEYWMLLHAEPGLKENNIGATPLVYFSTYSTDSNRNFITVDGSPYEDQYIIYMDAASKQLRARTLANPNAPGNRLRTSCPPELASSTCPSDNILATDVTGVSMRYFSRSGNEMNYNLTDEFGDPVYDTVPSPDGPNRIYGPDFPVVEVVEFEIKLSKTPGFNHRDTTKSGTIIRVALRNT